MARSVTFGDFRAGEWGRIGPLHAPKGSFSGQNMIVYRNGELGVRPGLKNISPSSGLPVGKVRTFGATPSVPQPMFIHLDADSKFYTFGGGGIATPSLAATAGVQTSPGDWFIEGGQLYYTGPGLTNSYSIDIQSGSTPVVAALTGSPSGRCIVQYGDRTVIGNVTGSLQDRLRFSDAANKNSWPAANFIDVGDAWGINSLHTQRQHLLIVKQEQHFVLTGVPGVNPVLRKVNTAQAAFRPGMTAMGDRDIVYGWPTNENYPYTFNGTTQADLDHLSDWLVYGANADGFGASMLDPGVCPIVGKNKGCAIFQPTNNRGLILLNGTWSKHTYGVNVGGAGLVGNNRWASGYHSVTVCDGGAAAAVAKVYVLNTEANSPGLESGSNMRAGDDSSVALTGNFDLPYYIEAGSEFYVKTVIVDFTKWNTGSATTNHFDLVVDALDTYQSTTVASNTVNFDEAAASSSTSGTLARRIFGFGEQGMGDGFQLHFTNVRGVSFRTIEVILEERAVRR